MFQMIEPKTIDCINPTCFHSLIMYNLNGPPIVKKRDIGDDQSKILFYTELLEGAGMPLKAPDLCFNESFLLNNEM